MGEKFQGVWVSYKGENIDSFLKQVGSGLMTRGLAKTLSTTYDIQYLGEEKFKIKTTNGPKTKVVEFKLGETIEEHNPAGDSFKGVWRMEDEKLVGEFKAVKSGKDLQMTREIVNGELVQKMKSGNAEATRYFKKKGH